MVLFWIISSAAKKKNPPRGRQPWDQARRRQEVPPIADVEQEVPLYPPVREAEQEVALPKMEPERKVPGPLGPFPGLGDLGKELREVFESEFFPEEKTIEENIPEITRWEGKKAYRIKMEPEAEDGEGSVLPVPIKDWREDTVLTVINDRDLKHYPLPDLNPQTVVQGIVMAEILQPPRARRPFRNNSY